jgi:hypothetical protein
MRTLSGKSPSHSWFCSPLKRMPVCTLPTATAATASLGRLADELCPCQSALETHLSPIWATRMVSHRRYSEGSHSLVFSKEILHGYGCSSHVQNAVQI